MDGLASTTTAPPAQPEPRELEQQPPPNLPADPRTFYRAGGGADSIPLVVSPETKHVLEQLGPPPFRKSSFPLMGFLASLYEHIAAHVARRP